MKSQRDLYGSVKEFLSTNIKPKVKIDEKSLYYKAALFSTASL